MSRDLVGVEPQAVKGTGHLVGVESQAEQSLL
jgi:hypothetical protein